MIGPELRIRVVVIGFGAVVMAGLIAGVRLYAAQESPRPWGMVVGSTACTDAAARIGAPAGALAVDWGGRLDSTKPSTLAAHVRSAYIVCQAGKLQALGYQAVRVDGPDSVDARLIDRLLEAKWRRLEGSAMHKRCGPTAFDAGALVVSIDATPDCGEFAVTYQPYRTWRAAQ